MKPTKEIRVETQKQIAKLAFDTAGKCFDGRQLDMSLLFEDGSVKTISITKHEIYGFIYATLSNQYKQILKDL